MKGIHNEFNSIIERHSENCNFYIDYATYIALGRRNYPLRTTRVFLKEGETLSDDDNCVPAEYETLHEVLASNSDKRIFLMGEDDFIIYALPYITRIRICVGSVVGGYIPNKFPIKEVGEYFHGRVEVEPKMLDSINKLKELGGLGEDDKLFQCPDLYTMYNYTRAKLRSNVEMDAKELSMVIQEFLTANQPHQPSTTVFKNDTLELRVELEWRDKLEPYPRMLTISAYEKLTRYSRGVNFETDKSDVSTYIDDIATRIKLPYKSKNGRFIMEHKETYDKCIIELVEKHFKGEDVWDIKL